jgi:hypothetical protein
MSKIIKKKLNKDKLARLEKAHRILIRLENKSNLTLEIIRL